MPKEEWGVKRVCPTTGKRFYDLNKDPIVSPYTGEPVVLDTGKGKNSLVADEPDAASEKEKESFEEEDIVLEDSEDESDVDLGDDVLDEDEDEDTVNLDDLADVAAEDNED